MKGVIKVAAIPTLNEELCCCLAELSKNHPKIQVIIDQMEGDEFMRCISADEYDFYFGANRMFSNLVGYNQVITKKTRLKLFVHNEVVEKKRCDGLGGSQRSAICLHQSHRYGAHRASARNLHEERLYAKYHQLLQSG